MAKDRSACPPEEDDGGELNPRKLRQRLPKAAKSAKDLLAHLEFTILNPLTPGHDRVRAIETAAKISGFTGMPDVDEDAERKKRLDRYRQALNGTAKVRAALKKYLRESPEARTEVLRIIAEIDAESRPRRMAEATPTPEPSAAP